MRPCSGAQHRGLAICASDAHSEVALFSCKCSTSPPKHIRPVAHLLTRTSLTGHPSPRASAVHPRLDCPHHSSLDILSVHPARLNTFDTRSPSHRHMARPVACRFRMRRSAQATLCRRPRVPPTAARAKQLLRHGRGRPAAALRRSMARHGRCTGTGWRGGARRGAENRRAS